MNVYLFGFSKRRNSTKRPTTTDGVNFDMELKQETSILNPALIVNRVVSGQPQQPTIYNYAYIPIFNRYYFINDWQYINGAWVCYCSVDVLASYKFDIATMSAYVLRSSSASDGLISDVLYPCKSGLQYNNDFFSMALSQTGLYVVGIISNSIYATDGAVTYYMMTAAEFGALKSFLLDEDFLSLAGISALADIPSNFVKSYFNPFEYIVSCRFFPVDYTVATAQATAVTELNIGWWKLSNFSTKRMPSGFFMDIQSNTIQVGAHPQASSRGAYLNHAPYTERVLIHPMLGTIVLDANKIDGGDSITVATRVDFTTGEALTYIGDATKNITLYTQAYQFAVNVQLAQISSDIFASARSAVQTVSGALFGGLSSGIPGAIAGAASGILNGIETSQPVLSSSGSNGNRAVYHVPVYLQAWYRIIVDEDNEDRGRPLCQVRTLGTLTGYIMCSEAHCVSMSAYDSEKQEVDNYLNTGFFYE